ncbi:MAG: hydroxyethylthiazole kinase [Desulfovibrio sp.]
MSINTQAFKALCNIREESPLIHNITNDVVMNQTANALLAIGASPVMAHAIEEVEEMASIASALVLNIGTLTTPQIHAMLLAGKAAASHSIPIILDPVGAGATAFRTETCMILLKELPISIVRGNGSEIAAIAAQLELISSEKISTKGVDSTLKTDAAILPARSLASYFNATIAVTGAVDFITDGKHTASITGGNPLMAAVTGMGCTSTAVCGAFAAACSFDKNKADKGDDLEYFQASISALATMKAAGKIAAAKSQGPGSFVGNFLDTLYNLTADNFSDVSISMH